MASITRQTNIIRKNRKTKLGQKRKRVARTKGTTPEFAIHPTK